MAQKILPVYYLAILWLVAIVAVFFILKPLVKSESVHNGMGNISDFTISRSKNINTDKAENNSKPAKNKKEQNVDTQNGNDLIFYDKTAFIRYFSNTYSEEELTDSYNKAMAAKSNLTERDPIRVIRKGVSGKTKKSFSGSFEIGPVPGN